MPSVRALCTQCMLGDSVLLVCSVLDALGAYASRSQCPFSESSPTSDSVFRLHVHRQIWLLILNMSCFWIRYALQMGWISGPQTCCQNSEIRKSRKRNNNSFEVLWDDYQHPGLVMFSSSAGDFAGAGTSAQGKNRPAEVRHFRPFLLWVQAQADEQSSKT